MGVRKNILPKNDNATANRTHIDVKTARRSFVNGRHTFRSIKRPIKPAATVASVEHDS